MLGFFSWPFATRHQQRRREKLAYFEEQCTPVDDGLFVGGDAVAKRWDVLHAHGITHVVNASASVSPNYFRDQGIQYLSLKLCDSPNEDLTAVLYDVFDFVEQAFESEGKVLIHCSQGVSRSVALATALVMRHRGLPYDEAFRRIKYARGVANPNMGFACQLVQWQKRVPNMQRNSTTAQFDELAANEQSASELALQYNSREPQPSFRASGASSPGSVAGSTTKCYIVLPLNKSDPSYCVAKAHHPPSAGLDPRGAYVIKTTPCVFVWFGSRVAVEPQRKARHFARQLGKYEGAPMPPVEVHQGKEPEDLLAAIEEGLSQPSKRQQVHLRHNSLDHELSLVNGELALDDSVDTEEQDQEASVSENRSTMQQEAADSSMSDGHVQGNPSTACVYAKKGSNSDDDATAAEAMAEQKAMSEASSALYPEEEHEPPAAMPQQAEPAHDVQEQDVYEAEEEARHKRWKSRQGRLGRAELFEYPTGESLGSVFDIDDLETMSAFVLAVPDLQTEDTRWVLMRVWIGAEYDTQLRHNGPEMMAAWVAELHELTEEEYDVSVDRERDESDDFWADFDFCG